jgi:hypothetical protein
MILIWIFKKWDRGMYCWIYLAEDRDRWRGSYEGGNEPSAYRKSGEFLH